MLLLHSHCIPVAHSSVLLRAVRYCGSTFAYTSIVILLNYVSPPHVVGLSNGLAQSIVSLARFVGPVSPVLPSTPRVADQCRLQILGGHVSPRGPLLAMLTVCAAVECKRAGQPVRVPARIPRVLRRVRRGHSVEFLRPMKVDYVTSIDSIC